MALTKCKECGSEISNKTKACPICGAPRGPKQYSLGKLLIVLLFGWFICAIITTDHTTSSYGGAATELLNALISRTGDLFFKQNKETDAKEAFETGKSLLERSPSQAGLYFVYALNRDPGNWELLNEYIEIIAQYADSLDAKGNSGRALSILSELDAFLRGQASYYSLNDLKKLESVISGLEEKRIQLEKNAIEREEVALELESAQDGIGNGTDRYAQTSKFVRNAVNQLDLEPTTLTVYKLSLIESAVQRLVLWSEARLVEESEVAQLVNDLEQAKERIAEKLSENVIAELRRAKDKLPKEGKYQHQINARIAFQKTILKRMPEVSSLTAKAEVEKMIADNQAALEALSKDQVTEYNNWAIGQIAKFYKVNKEQLKITKNTEEDILADEIYNRLGPIDVRLLQFAAQVGYQEVFNLFYQELDQDQKIDLTRKMVVEAKKKTLSDMPIDKTL